MPGKLPLYFWTIKYMKPSQIFHRMRNAVGMDCGFPGVRICRGNSCHPFPFAEELDFDPVFLARFSPEELLRDQVTFLHETEPFSWERPWHAENQTPLWNFNLHYFEYLHSLTKAFLETREEVLLEKTRQMILGWIKWNPVGQGGDGWSAYTVSLRLTNWLSYYASVGEYLEASFRKKLEDSIFQQYAYLSRHLEKHILGNHYFENLKALVLCALFFDDRSSLPVFLEAFRKECREQILSDGMHFERSPMYHKIVLEGLLRVNCALKASQISDPVLQQLAGSMLSAAWSMEKGLCRTPLFNDSGDNVAKSLDALLLFARNRLGLEPESRIALPEGGYYFFEKGPWRLIVDAGPAGPDYIPGHAHCDAMSFELYRDGVPVLTNRGTYAYQCPQRSHFRSTASHNTVQAAAAEQSEIWSTFRLARRSSTRVLSLEDSGIQMEMTDYRGNRIRRSIRLSEDALQVSDMGEALVLRSYLHDASTLNIRCSAPILFEDGYYAPEFGLLKPVRSYTAEAAEQITFNVTLE